MCTILCVVSSIDMSIGLKSKLNVVRKAHYAPREACLMDTWGDLLASVIPWVVDLKSPEVCWVYGLAGSEKSAVANSASKLLEEKKIPFTCFTCSGMFQI